MVTFISDYKKLVERQIENEAEMRNRGGKRTETRENKAVEKERESMTTHGKKLLKASIDKFETTIQTFLNENNRGPKFVAKKYLDQLDPKLTAVIAAKKIIDSVTSVRKFTAQAISLGGKIEDELYFQSFNQNPEHKALFESINKDLDKRSNHYEYRRWKLLLSSKRKGFEWERWPVRDKLLVGELLISLFIEATGLVQVEKIYKRKRAYNVLTATDKTLEWIKKVKDFNKFFDPEFYPLLCKPRKWKTSIGGGYISRHIEPMFLVTGNNITSHRTYIEELKNYDMPGVYNGLNTLQETPWVVNKHILNVAKTVFNDDSRNRGGLITSQLMQLPNKPHNISDKTPDGLKALSKWKSQATVVYTQNQKLKSKRLAEANTIYIGNKFADEPQIYHAGRLCFRDRFYYVTGYFNPQGTDLAKSMHLFANKKPLGTIGEKYLCLQLANTYGEDKISLDDRIKWVHKNKDQIIASAKDPFNNSFWEHADKPWQFLAATFEFENMVRLGLGYESGLPCNIDGSCNGLQNFSAVLRDEVGGKAVNLIDNDVPQDIYQVVADTVIEKLKLSNNTIAKEWLNWGIDRKATKRSVMVLPYGGTRYSCVEFVDEYVSDREEKGDTVPFKDRAKANIFLANIIWESIGNTVIKAREAMDWLQKVARLCAATKTPVHWTTPLGFPVKQAYYSQKDMIVKTKMMGRIRIRSNTDKINKRKQANGISPNFVHSLDATHMFLTIDHCLQNGLKDFGMVHDSYATLPADMEILNKCARSAFIQMYTEMDPLEHFKDQITALIPEKLRKKIPPLPKKGKLDIHEIAKAKYFFS